MKSETFAFVDVCLLPHMIKTEENHAKGPVSYFMVYSIKPKRKNYLLMMGKNNVINIYKSPSMQKPGIYIHKSPSIQRLWIENNSYKNSDNTLICRKDYL